VTIDPRVGLYLSIVLAVIGFIASAGTQLTTLFGAPASNMILSSAVLLLGVGNAVNAVLHAIPSKPGAVNEFPLGPKANP
jgi:hypothetical protein